MPIHFRPTEFEAGVAPQCVFLSVVPDGKYRQNMRLIDLIRQDKWHNREENIEAWLLVNCCQYVGISLTCAIKYS